MSDSVRLSLDEVHALATETFLANGGSPEQIRADADTVTAAERDECKSHGLFRVPGYIASIRSGKVNAVAEPKVERLAPGVVKVDGFNGFAPLALEVGREPLVDLAREQGIAALAITNTHHFAALWPETEALAERGLVGFAFVAAMAYVAPAGGSRRATSTPATAARPGAASSCSRSIPSSAASAATPSATPRPSSPASSSRRAPASPPTAATRPAGAPPPRASPSPEPSTTPSNPCATPDRAGQASKLDAEFAGLERCLTGRTGSRYVKL